MKTKTNPCNFRDEADAAEHAAQMVATFWLTSAARIIQRGESPAKLSSCHYDLVVGEVDRELYGKFARKFNLTQIGKRAIEVALAKLRTGQFPIVRKHFEVTSNVYQDRAARRLVSTIEGSEA